MIKYGKSCGKLIRLADAYTRYAIYRAHRLDYVDSHPFTELHEILATMLSDFTVTQTAARQSVTEFLCRSEMPDTLSAVLDWLRAEADQYRIGNRPSMR